MRRPHSAFRRWKNCRDVCETCGVKLRWPHKPVEVFALTSGNEFGSMGGGSVSATYCKTHAPKGDA